VIGLHAHCRLETEVQLRLLQIDHAKVLKTIKLEPLVKEKVLGPSSAKEIAWLTVRLKEELCE
jgi:hypothetical protein